LLWNWSKRKSFGRKIYVEGINTNKRSLDIPSILETCFSTFFAQPWQCIETFKTTVYIEELQELKKGKLT